MEVSLHLLRPLTPSPSPLPHRPLVFPLRRHRPRLRLRLRPLSFVRNSTDEPESPAAARPESATVSPSVFGGKKELTTLQAAVDAMAPPVRLASSVVVVAGALAAGYGLGFRLGGSRIAGAGGAAALGAAGGVLAYAINSCAPEVAAVNLHNYVAGCDYPGEVKREVVEEIPKRCGVNKDNEAFKAELCDLYSRFVSSVLPPGGENLKGNEVDLILKFKNALGIDDPDAATVHMEIGRRIFRERLESGDHDADIEQRRAFQKLVYVSNIVFGNASTFLLPWKRVFKVTDAQVEVAIRDNAQRLYAIKLNSVDYGINEDQLIDLKQAQLSYRLSDEVAADMLREKARKLVEQTISSALEAFKSRMRIAGSPDITEKLENILAFNDSLIALSNHPESSRFAPGLGPISLIGGEFDNDRKVDDLKVLYRAYVMEAFSSGRIDDSKPVALNNLKNIFGLGKRESEAIILDVTTRVYRRRLSQAVSSGDLDAAPSKASFLQNLCDELHFDPEKAKGIHEEIYYQKLQQSVADGELSDEDAAVLLRLRVMLCIPQETVDKAKADICGRIFEKVVSDAIAAGVDGYDADVRASVRKASKGLRLSQDVALDIAGRAVRKMFRNYIQRSKSSGSRTEAAKELKKMIAFNTLVVSELVADIKGESTSESVVEEPGNAKLEDVDDEWESLQTLRKTRPSKELEAKLGKPGQTEITLKDDLSEQERADLYRTYLVYCLQGEVTVVPFGAQITTKKDNSEYLVLNQLGVLLGMSGKEIVAVHRNLAEQAFRQQAQVILADGKITKAQIDQLNEVQKQVGLPPEAAQRVIKSITTTKMAAAVETAVSRGEIDIKQIRDLKEAGVIDLDSMVSESLRENLYKRTVKDAFSSGTGDFDEEEIYKNIPADLKINPEKAKRVVHDMASNRLSESLVQAVAQLRQRKPKEAISSLNDLLACDKAVPSRTLSWQLPEELISLYAVYAKGNPPPEKLSRLQYLLGISDSTVNELQNNPTSGDEGEDEAFVF